MKLTDIPELKAAILERMKELKWKDSDLISDANSRGIKITASQWSHYKNGKSAPVSSNTLIWVATRLGIDISIKIGKPKFDGKSLTWAVAPYNEEKAIENLSKLFS